MIKTVLAIIEGSTHTTRFVDTVLAMAEHWGAHMIFDVLTAAPLMSAKLAPFGTLYTLPGEMRHLAESHVGAVRAHLPSDTTAEVVSHFDDVGWLPGDLRENGPLADIILVGPPTDWSIDWLRRHTTENLLLSAGTPLLLLPAGRALRPVAHAVLGWKPGAPARQTLHNLINLASPGARIDVVSVSNGLIDTPDTAIEPVLAMLGRHGFNVEGHVLGHGETTADTLAAFALERGADVLAVGGFAHSRVHEILLGGVTRSMIEDPRLPVLMAH